MQLCINCIPDLTVAYLLLCIIILRVIALVEVINWCLVFVPVGAGSMSSLKV